MKDPNLKKVQEEVRKENIRLANAFQRLSKFEEYNDYVNILKSNLEAHKEQLIDLVKLGKLNESNQLIGRIETLQDLIDLPLVTNEQARITE